MNIFALLDVLIYGEYPQYYLNELEKKGTLFTIGEGNYSHGTAPSNA